MATKLPKRQFPACHGPDDFECFGPPAVKDGEFEDTGVADLGCFTQDGRDTNKFYHGAVVRSKQTGEWYAYFEWGRTGASRPDFQFVMAMCEDEARKAYEKQLHSKNDKRGEWTKISGIQALRAKKGKDCYLVRPQATRSTGLPGAKKIQTGDAPAKKTKKSSKARRADSLPDPKVMQLMHDLNVATANYTRNSMADDSIPTQDAINEGRHILTEALKRLSKVGDDPDRQVKDKRLREFSRLLYSRIPKVKPVGADESTWVLSQKNILTWQQDLDAFEQALSTSLEDIDDMTRNPLDGIDLEMRWLDPRGEGKWIMDFLPRATRNLHRGLGQMKVHNIWEANKPTCRHRFDAKQAQIAAQKPSSREKPMFSPRSRPDLNGTLSAHRDSRTALLFHGTRSVNVSGILSKSLMMPKKLVGVAITGAMFGPGTYWADDWKKAAGYCSLQNSFWSGGRGAVRGRKAFMFLGDVVLGKPFLAPGPRGYTSPPGGCHSVFGKANYSHVMNNEWIVYQEDQNVLRYLVEFET